MASPDRNTDRRIFIENSRNKGLARTLHAKQVNLGIRMSELARNDPERFKYWGGSIEPEMGQTAFLTEVELGVVVDSKINGISDVVIGFDQNYKNIDGLYRKVGVKTPFHVSANLYTDHETFDQVQQLYAYDWERFGFSLDEVKKALEDTLTSDEIDNATFPGAVVSDNLWTYLFTDKEGNFAKVIGIPEEIAQDRPDLMIEGHKIEGTISTQVPMLARDFILMANCIKAIDEGLDMMVKGEQ